MKNLFVCGLALLSWPLLAQSIEGTWQQTDNKTCFQSELKESDTERELEGMMGSNSKKTVAKLIVFKKDGSGQEGIFSAGKKKGSDMNPFQYKVSGQELLFIDKKSGIVIQRFVIEEMTDTSLKIHDAVKECETRAFIKVK